MKFAQGVSVLVCLHLAGCGVEGAASDSAFVDTYVASEELEELGDLWLDAVHEGAFEDLPLAPELRFTHNSIERDLLAEPLPARPMWGRRYYPDELMGQIVVFADTPKGPFNTRLRVVDGLITEAEAVQGVGLSFWGQGREVDEPLARERLIELVEAHLDSLESGVPQPDLYTWDVIRTENGQPFFGVPTCVGFLCAAEMPLLGAFLDEVGDRRKVVDIGHDVVMTWIDFHFPTGHVLPLTARFTMRGEAIAGIEVVYDFEGLDQESGWTD